MSHDTRKALVRGGSLGLALLLFAALLLMVNYLGWKYHQRWDWTGEQLYTLSEKTENVLAGLDRDVEAVVLLQPGTTGGAGGFDAYEATRELLNRYEAASPRLSVRYLDPFRQPAEAQRVVAEYGLDQTAAVVFVAGDGGDGGEAEERRVLTVNDLVEFDFSGLQFGESEEVAGFRGEQRFTQALVDLSEGEKPRVLFVTGHGEIALDDRSPNGFGVLPGLLGEDNFEIEEWASLGAERVPEGTDLLVVAGPTGTFLESELSLFGDYLAAGGRMLLLLDPVLGGAGAFVPTGFGPWLEGYGVEIGDTVVFDPSMAIFAGAESFYVNRYPSSHPVTRSVARGPLAARVSIVRSVAVAADVPGDLEATVLAESTPDGWGETDLQAQPERGPDDVAGPVPLAVAVSSSGGDGEDGGDGSATGGLRLVVYGTSTFAGDRLLDGSYPNQALLLDTFNWLVQREGMIGLPAKRPEQVRLALEPSQVRWVLILVLLLLPGLGAAAGVYVHFRRRR
jgi:hypothetical protein